jgi:hypothetical protein
MNKKELLKKLGGTVKKMDSPATLWVVATLLTLGGQYKLIDYLKNKDFPVKFD